MITYSTNWMGVVSTSWYEDNNIPYKDVTRFSKLLNKEVTARHFEVYYSCGRIDIRGVKSEPWGLEYSVSPMHSEDWDALGDWLWDFESKELLTLDELLTLYGKPIRWHKDII